MVSIKQIQIFIFLLALIAFQEIQFLNGRELKDMKGDKSDNVITETPEPSDAKKPTKLRKSPDTHKEEMQVTRKHIFPSPPSIQSHELSSSEMSHPEGFAPTTPGNSPGVGHSKNDKQAKVQDFTPVAEEINDFRPTGPGHSPGVGHSFGTKNAGPRA